MPRLSGIELLEAYESMVMIPRDDMVRRCGYVTIDQDGTEVIHYAAFYDALALADSKSCNDEIDGWFIESTCVTYSTTVISHYSQLNQDLLEQLMRCFRDAPRCSPFCNIGDYDLSDLKHDIPPGWTIQEKGQLPVGTARISLIYEDYTAHNYLDIFHSEAGIITSLKLGCVYALSVEHETSDNRNVIECACPSDRPYHVLFLYNSSAEGLIEEDCRIADFPVASAHWRAYMGTYDR